MALAPLGSETSDTYLATRCALLCDGGDGPRWAAVVRAPGEGAPALSALCSSSFPPGGAGPAEERQGSLAVAL